MITERICKLCNVDNQEKKHFFLESTIYNLLYQYIQYSAQNKTVNINTDKDNLFYPRGRVAVPRWYIPIDLYNNALNLRCYMFV